MPQFHEYSFTMDFGNPGEWFPKVYTPPSAGMRSLSPTVSVEFRYVASNAKRSRLEFWTYVLL